MHRLQKHIVQSVLSSDILKPSFPQTCSPETTMLLHPRERQQLPEAATALLSLNQRNPITSFHFSVPPPPLTSTLPLFPSFSFFLSLQYISVALSISCLVKLPRRANTRQWDAANLWYLKQRALCQRSCRIGKTVIQGRNIILNQTKWINNRGCRHTFILAVHVHGGLVYQPKWLVCWQNCLVSVAQPFTVWYNSRSDPVLSTGLCRAADVKPKEKKKQTKTQLADTQLSLQICVTMLWTIIHAVWSC